jgi:prevent-host-death family protein
MNPHARVWSLQEAKAKFSEVVRRAQTEGPQTVTVHGKAAVIVSGATPPEPRLIAGKHVPTGTGLDLIRAMQACPFPDFEIPERPVLSGSLRDIEFE